MRISSIQNFAANAIDKCCRPRKSVENNNVQQNSLKRSPAADTVSFGKFDENYRKFLPICVAHKLLESDYMIQHIDAFRECRYLKLTPTKDSLLDPDRATCKLDIVSYAEIWGTDNEKEIKHYDGLIRKHINDFNEMNGLEPGWEQNLYTPEEFAMAAELSNYVESHGYMPSRGSYDDPMDDMTSWCHDHLAE